MVRLVVLGLLLFSATCARAGSLEHARDARALLGPGGWSRVLRIENHRSDPRHALTFHALVFVVEDRLWLYDSNEGTQSLSRYAGRLEDDKANLAPLLAAVLPNFTSFQDVTDELPNPSPSVSGQRLAPLPYGCFIECIVHWRELLSGASPPEEGGILAFYFDTTVGPHGHSMLIYRQNGRRYAYDPASGEATPVPPGAPISSPLQLARAVVTLPTPFKAHLLALHAPLASQPVALMDVSPGGKRPLAGSPAARAVSGRSTLF